MSGPRLGPHNLVVGYYTLLRASRAGAGEWEPARASLEVRAAVAADAAYAGLGILMFSRPLSEWVETKDEAIGDPFVLR